MRVAILAPSRRLNPTIVDPVEALFSNTDVALIWAPQCFESCGHFAGDDTTRAAAILEYGRNPDIDAIWFGCGGYGAMRLGDGVFDALARSDTARGKLWLGYSDTGAILARLYRLGFARCYHAPMPIDITRKGGTEALVRVRKFLQDPSSHITAHSPMLAMNLCILTALCGTHWMPPLEGHTLLLEDVGEHLYALDRMMFTLSQQPEFPQLSGVKCGRFSSIPENDVDFGETAQDIIQRWCLSKDVAYLGRADIGHDIENKIIPFGRG